MSLCNVLSDDSSSELIIKFKYSDQVFEKSFSFKRQAYEILETFKERMKINLKKAFSKKNRNDIFDINIDFYQNSNNVDLKITNKDFWKDGSELHINDQIYSIKLNYPTVVDLKLSNYLMTGYPIFPRIEIYHGFVEHSDFIWYKLQSKNDIWIKVGENFLYEVKTDDFNCKLKIVCLPKNLEKTGLSEEAVSDTLVIKGLVGCPFEKRFLWTQKNVEENKFRIVSYNLLADHYSKTDHSKDVLYSHCQGGSLKFDYRKLLILKELIGYNSDIYCLQEIDNFFYKKALNIILKQKGFDSCFAASEESQEGLSVFVNSSKFKIIEHDTNTFGHLLHNSEYLRELKLKVYENSNLIQRMTKLKNNFQFLLLESTKIDKRLLILCNLHLYSKDDADHIRLFQTFIVLKHIEHNIKRIKYLYKDYLLSVLIVGDFNSTPEFGVLKLIQNKSVHSSLEDFKSNDEEIVENFVLEHGINLKSACGFPDYTHFAKHFFGCLDYIFYDYINLEPSEIVPMPEHSDVVKEIALPNRFIPSDHLPLICTLKWK